MIKSGNSSGSGSMLNEKNNSFRRESGNYVKSNLNQLNSNANETKFIGSNNSGKNKNSSTLQR